MASKYIIVHVRISLEQLCDQHLCFRLQEVCQIAKMTAVIAGDSIKPFLGRFQFVRAENLEAWLKVRHLLKQTCLVSLGIRHLQKNVLRVLHA